MTYKEDFNLSGEQLERYNALEREIISAYIRYINPQAVNVTARLGHWHKRDMCYDIYESGVKVDTCYYRNYQFTGIVYSGWDIYPVEKHFFLSEHKKKSIAIYNQYHK